MLLSSILSSIRASRNSLALLSTSTAAAVDWPGSSNILKPICKGTSGYEKLELNWSENIRLTNSTNTIATPSTLEELQDIARAAKGEGSLRTLGSGHSFNSICCPNEDGGTLISLSCFSAIHSFDLDSMTVSAEGGVTYGQLNRWLAPRGLALRNMASLPHITVSGAIATGSHGSGMELQNLAADIAALEFVRADGSTIQAKRDNFLPGNSVSVFWNSCLGIISKIAIDVVPSYDIRQCVLQDVPFMSYIDNFEAICHNCHGISAFIDFSKDNVEVLWIRDKIDKSNTKEKSRSNFSSKMNSHGQIVPDDKSMYVFNV
eukprot:GSMAST32.ASY1.ANO1.1991.1 assembled CDS